MNASDATDTLAPLDPVEFLYHEARLLDDGALPAWLALFADDGLYWMPLRREQREDDIHTSLLREDPLLLRLRIERLHAPRAFSQQPASRCHHVLQRPRLEAEDGSRGEYRLRTEFSYTEVRGNERYVTAGTARHHLVTVDGRLRILRKRVDLIDGEGVLPSIQLFP